MKCLLKTFHGFSNCLYWNNIFLCSLSYVQKPANKLHQIVIGDVRHLIDDHFQFASHRTFRIPKAAREHMPIAVFFVSRLSVVHSSMSSLLQDLPRDIPVEDRSWWDIEPHRVCRDCHRQVLISLFCSCLPKPWFVLLFVQQIEMQFLVMVCGKTTNNPDSAYDTESWSNHLYRDDCK